MLSRHLVRSVAAQSRRRVAAAAAGTAAAAQQRSINTHTLRPNTAARVSSSSFSVPRRHFSSSSSSPKTVTPEVEQAAARLVDAALEAQRAFVDTANGYDQAKIDAIFKAVALEATVHRLDLAKLAVADTDMGVVEDKVIKNHFAAEFPFNKYKDAKTMGVIESDERGGFERVAEPVGPILAIVPVTNPTSTIIFKSLLALKTRNAVLFCPHPRAAKCSAATVKLLNDAAVKAGAPANILQCVPNPSSALSDYLVHHPSIKFLLATGGGSMVRACYSSGKPAIGVGAGNCPALIDETADLQMAVSSILMSKTFDNGVICASEQTVVVVQQVYEQVLAEFKKRGAYIVIGTERDLLRKLMFPDGDHVSSDVVGQSAIKIAERAGFSVPIETQMLLVPIDGLDDEPLALEKMSPVLSMVACNDFMHGTQMAHKLVNMGGLGHTSSFYTDARSRDRIHHFESTVPTCRILIDSPATFGAIGDVYNFRLEPALSLGCGSWGGNSFSGNVGVNQLLNIKTMAERRENMLFFKVPKSIYFKRDIIVEALKDVQGAQRCLIVTDTPMVQLQVIDPVVKALIKMGIKVEVFHDVTPDPTVKCINDGVKRCVEFQPDLMVAIGGGSPMDAAKVIRLLYEHPEINMQDLYTRFMDIRKRVVRFPALGSKIKNLICVPTTSGTGAEVTPFAVIKDDITHRKYPLADYALTPDIAIVDVLYAKNMPKNLAANTGLDVLTHAIESYVSVVSSDFTRPLSLQSINMVFKHLRASVLNGPTDLDSRENIHHASCLAGMAFGNAFLGVCHSMAHALGSEFGIPHGLANALCLPHVIAFNASNAPRKRAAFSQYKYFHTLEDYGAIALYARIGERTESNQALTLKLIREVESLCRDIGIVPSIQALGVSKAEFEAKIDRMAELAFDDQCTGANPRYPLIEELKQLYKNAYTGEVDVKHLL